MVKVFKGIVNFIFIVAIIVLIGYFLLRITNKVEIYTVKTGSMEDKIHVGDYILIYRKSSYNVGDVVTFTTDGGYVTHRIIKKEGRTITTKGDANNTVDDVIKESIIVGKVIMSGGILNIIVDYKFAFAGILLSLYLISCYIGDGEDTKEEEDSSKGDEENNDNLSEIDKNEENISETKEELEKIPDEIKLEQVEENSEGDNDSQTLEALKEKEKKENNQEEEPEKKEITPPKEETLDEEKEKSVDEQDIVSGELINETNLEDTEDKENTNDDKKSEDEIPNTKTETKNDDVKN